MRVVGELISIGDELLSGKVVNGNAAHIARELLLAGYRLRWVTTVGDNEDDIGAALEKAMGRAAFVIATGGLGPTEDDRTSSAVARVLQRPLERDPVSWQILTSHLEKIQAPMNPGIERMAQLPAGARRIDLERPRAGYYIDDAAIPLFFLPGVPQEMAEMMSDFVIPTLRERLPASAAIRTRTLRIIGVRESVLAQELADLEQAFPDIRVGYLPSYPEVRLTLTTEGATAAAAEERLDAFAAGVRDRLGFHVYGEGEDSLAQVVGHLLQERRHKLAVAESCTGGLVAHLLTEVPGSSKYFSQAVVAYDEEAKVAALGVDPGLLARQGAVSSAVAAAMARGLQKRSQADITLALTGVAGPEGGTPEHPVGTVFLALLFKGRLRVDRMSFRGGRQEIKLAAAHTGLDLVRRALQDPGFFDATAN